MWSKRLCACPVHQLMHPWFTCQIQYCKELLRTSSTPHRTACGRRTASTVQCALCIAHTPHGSAWRRDACSACAIGHMAPCSVPHHVSGHRCGSVYAASTLVDWHMLLTYIFVQYLENFKFCSLKNEVSIGMTSAKNRGCRAHALHDAASSHNVNRR